MKVKQEHKRKVRDRGWTKKSKRREMKSTDTNGAKKGTKGNGWKAKKMEGGLKIKEVRKIWGITDGKQSKEEEGK